MIVYLNTILLLITRQTDPHGRPVPQMLENALPEFHRRIKSRERELILLAPARRRIVLKLLVLRTFLESSDRRRKDPTGGFAQRTQGGM